MDTFTMHILLAGVFFLRIAVYYVHPAFITGSIIGKYLSQLKEKLRAELLSLKAQINPHSLFNVLNSMYVAAGGAPE